MSLLPETGRFAPPARLAQAAALLHAGWRDQAEELLREQVRADASPAPALHLLGVIAFQRRCYADALGWFRAAAAACPGDAHTLSCVGAACQELGRPEEALTWHRAAQRLAPADPLVLNGLGITLQRLGRFEEAAAAFAGACHADPHDPAPPCNRGAALAALGRAEEAAASFREALARSPNQVEAHQGLGDAQAVLGRYAEAEGCYRRALSLRPHHVPAHRRLGDLLGQRGRPAEAVEAYRWALLWAPADGGLHVRLGEALLALNRVAEAVACGRDAVGLAPADADAHNHLGNALHAGGDLGGACGSYRRAAELRPDWSVPHYNFGVALLGQGRLAEAHTAMAEARRLNPPDVVAASTAVGTRHYDPDADGPSLLAEARGWAQTYAGGLLGPTVHANVPDPGRRLRVGYVSPDFRAHAVAYFLEPILAHHDPARTEVFCYADVPAPDAMTARLRGLAHHWRPTNGQTHAEVAEQVLGYGIDVLVDLCGHLAGSRLLTFARRPAPVQVSYLGYPGTAGLEAIAYRLADAVTDPPNEPCSYTEELVRLPGCFCCYAPPATPELPGPRSGPLTFGSLHKLEKLNDRVLDLWRALLDDVPGSRLILARHVLHGETADFWRRHLREHGFALDRVELRPIQAVGMKHLEVYADIDVALDAWPWSGHTTACEALWMGVPVVTLRGDQAAGRMTASVLTCLGLGEWVADNPDAYRRVVATLTADREWLAEWRRTLRDRMAASPLCDGAAFTRGLENVYRTLWRRWCAGRREDGG